jgi:hypothetical protein
MGCEKDTLVKKIYLNKLEQFVVEMFEQNALAYAIQESLYEALVSGQAQLKEYSVQVEKQQGRSVTFQQNQTVWNSVQEWKRSLGYFLRTLGLVFETNLINKIAEKLQQEAAECIQSTCQIPRVQVYCNPQTKTTYCSAVEMVGLYLAPLIQVPSVDVTKQQKRCSLPLVFIKEMEEALNSINELIDETQKQHTLKYQQTKEHCQKQQQCQKQLKEQCQKQQEQCLFLFERF